MTRVHEAVRLAPAGAAELDALLARDPLLTVYLRSELRLAGTTHPWWVVAGDGGIRAALLGGALASPWIPDLGDAVPLAHALERQMPPRLMVGAREHVLALHRARADAPQPRDVRDPQPVMVLRRGMLRAEPAPQVRLATIDSLDRLTVAAAAMHREEIGLDELALDPAAWRPRLTTLIERRWSWVWLDERGDVVFKSELSALTEEYAQIQGVWTAPAYRNRHVGRAGLAAVCAAVLQSVPAVCLYVNSYNAPALRLYHGLGFEHVADYATLLY